MKIVLNKCYGGFGLSTEAQDRLIELGIPLYKSYDDIPEEFNKPRIVNSDSSIFGKYDDNFYNYEFRSHPLLLQVIEELGEDKCNNALSELSVVEIPDDIEWSIDDYDGIESIHENHRSW